MSAHTNRILAARLGVATMKLKHLVAELEGVRTWEKPKVALEQYPTSPEIAAHMLISAMEHGDVEDAAVADLGCGGGILGIGAAILGASHVLAVDIDPDALSVAAENVAEFEVPVDLICCDMSRLPTRRGLFDCVITNPPFGTQKDSNGIDMVFLRAGFDMVTQVAALMGGRAQRPCELIRGPLGRAAPSTLYTRARRAPSSKSRRRSGAPRPGSSPSCASRFQKCACAPHSLSAACRAGVCTLATHTAASASTGSMPPCAGTSTISRLPRTWTSIFGVCAVRTRMRTRSLRAVSARLSVRSQS